MIEFQAYLPLELARDTVLEAVSKGKSVKDIWCRAKGVAGLLPLTPCRLAESKHFEAS